MLLQEISRQQPWFITLMVGLFSLAVGSFLNVVIFRLPIMLKQEWEDQCKELMQIKSVGEQKRINLFFPRSFCPQCKQLVKAWQNIPLISYFFLRGKCNKCSNPIPVRYPIIELITCLLSIYAYWHFGLSSHFVFAMLAIWLLIAMFFIDLDHQLLPDSLTLGLLWLGLIANTQTIFTSLPIAVLSAAGAYMSLWIVMQVFYLLTGKIGMGHGDFKLFAAFGAWFGWVYLPFILLMSSVAGSIIGLIYLKASKQNKETTIPFGPFLCLAGLITLFYGPKIIDGYLSWCCKASLL